MFIYKSQKINKFTGAENWAVVTGATAGIGEGFCDELAKRKTNLVLVSRDETKLKALSKRLEETYKIETKIVKIDFSKPVDYSEFTTRINSLNISILVNNVGINTEFPDYFLSNTDDEIEDLINVNLKSSLYITKHILPIFVSKKKE